MKNPRTWLGAVLVFCCLLSSALAITPLKPNPVLIKLAPAEQPIVFFHSFGITSPEAQSDNKTEQLFADPDMVRFVAEVRRLIMSAISKGVDNLQTEEERARAKRALDVLERVYHRPMSVYLANLSVSGPQGLEAAFVIDAGDEIGNVESTILEFLSDAPEGVVRQDTISGVPCYVIQESENDPPVYWAVRKTLWIATVGDRSFENLIAQVKTDVPNWMKAAVKRLPVPRRHVFGFADMSRVTELVQSTGEEDATKIWSALGMADIQSLSLVSGLDETGLLTRALLACDDYSGLLRLAVDDGMTGDDLARIPGDVQSAAAVSLDLGVLFDVVMDIIDVQPEPAQQAEAGIAQVNAMLGTDIRQDLLESLGNKWTFYQPRNGRVMMMFPEIVIAATVDDSDKLRETLVAISAFANQALAARGGPMKIAPTEIAGYEASYLTGLPMAPAWCLTEDQLVVATSAAAVKAHLERAPDASTALGSQQRVAAVLADGAKPLVISFNDLATALEQSYSSVQMMVNTGAAQLQQQGLDFDVTTLPSMESITKYLVPSVVSVHKADDGLELAASETMPQLATSSSGVLVALLLPAVNAARSAARRSGAINNLRQISLALANHESAHRHFPTAARKTKDGGEGLSWRVSILPFLEEQTLYDSFHLDEPWDSEHNKQLIAKMPAVYASPASRAEPGKTNYLAVSGEDAVIVAGDRGTSLAEVRDGTSKTAVVVEVDDDRRVIWTKPDDYEWDQDDPTAGLGNLHPGGIILLTFCDAHVSVISKDADKAAVTALYTKDGGETVNEADLAP